MPFDDADKSLVINTNITSGLLSSSLLHTPHYPHQKQKDLLNCINPLLNFAAPLLAVASELHQQCSPPNPTHLLASLAEKIKLFENKAHACGYRSQIILAGRFFLCATVDELIQTSDWGKKSQWEKNNLLTVFQQESSNERFFAILARSAEDAPLYIDVLELAYICLSMGFQGKYRKQSNFQELSRIVDNLYYLIRQTRGESIPQLLVGKLSQPQKKSFFRLPPLPIWCTLLISIVTLVAIYLPYHQRLSAISTPMLQTIKQMEILR